MGQSLENYFQKKLIQRLKKDYPGAVIQKLDSGYTQGIPDLLILFGIGYFIGTVENKQEFIKETANRINPAKEAKVIDLKSEIARDLENRQAGAEIQADTEATDNKEDGE